MGAVALRHCKHMGDGSAWESHAAEPCCGTPGPPWAGEHARCGRTLSPGSTRLDTHASIPACPVPLTMSVYLLSVCRMYLRPPWISSMICGGQ